MVIAPTERSAMTMPLILTFVFGVPLVFAALCDLTSYTIKNKICLSLVIGFFLIAPFAGLSWTEFSMHLLVGFGALLLMMALFAIGGLGGGDAKLFAATSLWWLPMELFTYAVYTALIGGVVAVSILLLRRFIPVRVATTGWVHRLLRDEKKIPYGLALAPAALLTLTQSSIFYNISLI